MKREIFEKFFQKPEGFLWSEEMQCYYEHKVYRFKYPLESIGEFNLKWQGWVAAQQVAQAEQGHYEELQALKRRFPKPSDDVKRKIIASETKDDYNLDRVMKSLGY